MFSMLNPRGTSSLNVCLNVGISFSYSMRPSSSEEERKQTVNRWCKEASSLPGTEELAEEVRRVRAEGGLPAVRSLEETSGSDLRVSEAGSERQSC